MTIEDGNENSLINKRGWFDTGGTWSVYGLTDPTLGNGCFYVGMTGSNVETRVAQHRCDRSSAAYNTIKDIEEMGEKVGYCIFVQMCSEAAARHLETSLIITLPHIVNRTNELEGAAFWRPFVGVRFAA